MGGYRGNERKLVGWIVKMQKRFIPATEASASRVLFPKPIRNIACPLLRGGGDWSVSRERLT